jgi:hypothetical protein
MGFKLTFLVGFAAGYVAGTAAGRERYEQIKSVSSKVTDNPAVQKAAGTVSSTATDLAKTAKDKAGERLPRFTETAKDKASSLPGLRGRVNGSGDYPDSSPGSQNPPGTSSYPD